MKRNLTSRRLQLETLEERTLLAVTAGAEQALLPAAADTVSLSKNTGETIDLSREKALTTESDYITGKTVPFNGSYQDLAEIDKGAISIYKKHFPDAKELGDVKTIGDGYFSELKAGL